MIYHINYFKPSEAGIYLSFYGEWKYSPVQHHLKKVLVLQNEVFEVVKIHPWECVHLPKKLTQGVQIIPFTSLEQVPKEFHIRISYNLNVASAEADFDAEWNVF